MQWRMQGFIGLYIQGAIYYEREREREREREYIAYSKKIYLWEIFENMWFPYEKIINVHWHFNRKYLCPELPHVVRIYPIHNIVKILGKKSIIFALFRLEHI